MAQRNLSSVDKGALVPASDEVAVYRVADPADERWGRGTLGALAAKDALVAGDIPEVTSAMQSDVAQNTLRGRASVGSGDIENIAVTEATVVGRQTGGALGVIARVSTAERTAGTETALRAFAPADVASIAAQHGGAGAGSGTGDMLASVYDPTAVSSDAFAMDNMVEGTATKIMTADERTKLDGIEAAADVTDATNVDAAGAVMESDFNAQTILAATADNTPAPLTIGEQTMPGRITGGNIAALTPAQIRTMLNVTEGGSGLTPTEVTISGGAHTLVNNTLSVIVSTDGSGCTLPAIGAADKLIEVWTEDAQETVTRGSTDTIQDGSATDFEIPPYHSAVFAAKASTADWHVTLRPRFNHAIPPLYTYTGGAMVLDFQGGTILRVLVTTNFSGQWPLPTGLPAAPAGAVLRGELHIEIDGTARQFTNPTPWALWSSGSEWKVGDEIQGAAPYVDGTAGATTKVSFTSARVSGAWEHQLEGQILESETTMDCRTLADADYTFADGDNGIAYHMTPTAARTLYFPTSTKKGWRCQVMQFGSGPSPTAALVSTGTLKSKGNAYTHDGENAVVSYWCESNATGNAPVICMAGHLTV